ncbi:HK97 family phage prohead protease [Ancylobacter mangrovi]|uniref:HK97 family phage prohead protease n=1 Tax=Ancylobacter mangrovi TaxID=2972472 RepID=UPI0021638E4F|nr:HK97 family phage prohead protease [Ancylobacter mangrovi]MCS0501613.1 HK97 family phage prohead protease [Ancylobacter mangrovi]
MELSVIGVPFEIKFAADEALAGTFEGYGAVFGNVDSHGDVIEPGAFTKSLLEMERAGRGLPPMYKMHGMTTGNRTDPIGIWEAMSEDANGLYVKGRLVGLDTEQGKWTYAQMREGALKGLSIGYRVPPGGSRRGSGRTGDPLRTIKSVILREVSLVDSPSNVLARIYSAKSLDDDGGSYADEIKTIRDFEEFLRDVGDFSHAAAKAIAAGGFKARPEPRDEDGEALKAFIADAANRLRGC